MPDAAYTECRVPRCPNYAVLGGYCETHSDHVTNRRYAEPGDLNPSNRRFRHKRLWFLRHHPMCAMCKREPATVLDHITPHRGIAMLFWSQHNWQGLCTSCHGVKTAGETLGARYA